VTSLPLSGWSTVAMTTTERQQQQQPHLRSVATKRDVTVTHPACTGAPTTSATTLRLPGLFCLMTPFIYPATTVSGMKPDTTPTSGFSITEVMRPLFTSSGGGLCSVPDMTSRSDVTFIAGDLDALSRVDGFDSYCANFAHFNTNNNNVTNIFGGFPSQQNSGVVLDPIGVGDFQMTPSFCDVTATSSASGFPMASFCYDDYSGDVYGNGY